MKSFVVITGASSGIGHALALHFSQLDYPVLAIARRENLLADLHACSPKNIIPLCADVSTELGRTVIVEQIKKIGNLQYLIHNAGVVEPMGQLTQIDLSSWKNMQAVNVEAPLALTQKLQSYFIEGSDNRILHVSSAAAHLPLQAIAAYSVSKAALFMIYQLLRDELACSGISVGSVCPGIIDTAMTDSIADDLPHAQYETAAWFKTLKTQHDMLSPKIVSQFLAWLLLKVDSKTFREKEWDIYDRTHHSAWLGEGVLPIPPEIDAQVNGY